MAAGEGEDLLRRGTGEARSLDPPRPSPQQNKLFEDAVRCPPGSFGRAYADFMDRRRFQADERPPVTFARPCWLDLPAPLAGGRP